MDDAQDSQLLITRQEKRQRLQPGGGGTCRTPQAQLKDTMESPPQPTPSTELDDKSDSGDVEGGTPNKEQNPSDTPVPAVPGTGEQDAAAPVVCQRKDWELPLGKGKGGLGMVKQEVLPKPVVPLAAKSKAIKKVGETQKPSPKTEANRQALSESGTGSGEEKTKVENNLDNEVKKALNRSGTAEKVDESKTEESTKKKPKKPRDNVAHARRMRFYRSLESWGLKLGIIT